VLLSGISGFVRTQFRAFVTVALLLIAALCGVAVHTYSMSLDVAMGVWVGVAGILVTLFGFSPPPLAPGERSAEATDQVGSWRSVAVVSELGDQQRSTLRFVNHPMLVIDPARPIS
jgi:hypothetical protein